MSVEPDGGFEVRLDNFTGPFDLLLSLIAKHELDITEVALSRVTDEFIAHVRVGGQRWDLERASSFLLVAATLLDLKAARLLPSGEVEDAEDLAVLEARDLLFARLMQYRAFKRIAEWILGRLEAEARSRPRPGGLEERLAAALPPVRISMTPAEFARLAAGALAPKPAPVLALEHLHTSPVSVVEQANLVADLLRREGRVTFRALVAGVDKITAVVRFLVLLELYRDEQVSFAQAEPLAELEISWRGTANGEVAVLDEYENRSAP